MDLRSSHAAGRGIREWAGVALSALIPGAAGLALDTPLPTKLPAGFEAVVFAAPPLINYPTFVCPGEAGELFIAVDKNASIDTKPDRGFIVKLVDDDGDGKADRRTEYAQVSSPRGLEYDGEWVYCLHPPTLTRFRDTDGDGVSDERQELVSGIGFDLMQRPPDHTSNGVTLGIDGWLYLAIGDFGFMEAKGTDGRTLRLHAGGVVRVRPDGSGLEPFATGTRNIYEAAVDPWLNVFARDNTNDGGGWDIRVHALFHGAEMGYPRLFKNFADETMPSLGVYGGGSGTGATYIQEPSVPAPYGDMLYTADWGRNAVYYHPLKGEKGAWFDLGQEVFCEIERPTSLRADGSGNIYIASWKGGEYTYKGEDVGYIVRVRGPQAQEGKALPPLRELDPGELARQLGSLSHTRRLAAQQAILRRPADARPVVAEALRDLLQKDDTPQTARIAILATLKQLMGPAASGLLGRYGAADPRLKEFAMRLIADRPTEAPEAVVPHMIAALKDPNDHVKSQAVIALSRLNRVEAAPAILELAAQAPLVENEEATAVEPRAATANVKGTATTRLHSLECDITGATKLFLVVTDGGNGNGVDHADWVEPMLRGPAGEKRLTDLAWATATAGWSEVRVGLNAIGRPLTVGGRPVGWGIGTHAVSVIGYDLPEGHGWTTFATQAALDDSSVEQNPQAGSVQFQVYVDHLPPAFAGAASEGSTPAATDWRRSLPHLADRALVRLQAHAACFSALDSHGDRGTTAAALRVIRQLHLPEVVTGLIDRLETTDDARLRRGLITALIRLYYREAEWDGNSWGTRPDSTGPYYRLATWSESDRIEAAVRAALAKAGPEETKAAVAQLSRHRVEWVGLLEATDSSRLGDADSQWAEDAKTLVAAMAGVTEMKPGAIGLLEPPVAIERTLAALAAGQADASVGEKLFTSCGCAACHTVEKDAAPKGPNLHDIAKRYPPAELLMSLINPSATIAQGFPTNVIDTKEGETFAGFVMRESADEVVLRNMAAVTQVIKTASIAARRKEDAVSSMTPGLVNPLQPAELASLLKYLQELK
ncbi:MAG: NPCBM/NEW2 domain-containing protein [Verrucomicrobiales bacterium]